MTPVADYLQAGWSAFYHRRDDGMLVNGFVTNGRMCIAASAEDIAHHARFGHLNDVHFVEGTPIVHVRRKHGYATNTVTPASAASPANG